MNLDPRFPRTPSPADFEDSPLARVLRQPMILGLFLPTQSGGWSASAAPRSTSWEFDYNAALALRAEELGFDLVFGLAEWVRAGGYGGKIRFREDLDRSIHYRDRAGHAYQTATFAVDHSRPLWSVASHASGALRGNRGSHLEGAIWDQRRDRIFSGRTPHVRHGSFGTRSSLRDGGRIRFDCQTALAVGTKPHI